MLHPIDKIELEIIKLENEISLLKERIKIELAIYQASPKASKQKVIDIVELHYKMLEESYRNLYDAYKDLLEKQTEIIDDEIGDDDDDFSL